MRRLVAFAAVALLLLSADPAEAQNRNRRRRNRADPAAGGDAGPGARPEEAKPDASAPPAERLRTTLQRPSAPAAALARDLDALSTGRMPASASSLNELAAAISAALAGRTAGEVQAKMISDALGVAARAEGLPASRVAGWRQSLSKALTQTGASEEAVARVQAAYDQVANEQRQEAIVQLKTDLQAIQSGSQVTQAQVEALAASLKAVADGATRPDPATVDQLAADLAAALDDGELSPKEQAQLVYDVQAVLTSANIPQEEVEAVIADAKAILEAADVDQAEVQAVVNDMKAIAATLPR